MKFEMENFLNESSNQCKKNLKKNKKSNKNQINLKYFSY